MFRESNAPGRTDEILRTETAHFRTWLADRLSDGATRMGRPLYEQLGWSASNEMVKALSAAN